MESNGLSNEFKSSYNGEFSANYSDSYDSKYKNFAKVSSSQESISFLKATDRELPLAVVSKIMKKPVPSVAKLSKDSKELMQKCSSEFIAIITCRAKEICDAEARKTITGDDLIRAMDDLDMPYYCEYTKKVFDSYKDSINTSKSGAHGYPGYTNRYDQHMQ